MEIFGMIFSNFPDLKLEKILFTNLVLLHLGIKSKARLREIYLNLPHQNKNNENRRFSFGY